VVGVENRELFKLEGDANKELMKHQQQTQADFTPIFLGKAVKNEESKSLTDDLCKLSGKDLISNP
jgi:hypothetical protein